MKMGKRQGSNARGSPPYINASELECAPTNVAMRVGVSH